MAFNKIRSLPGVTAACVGLLISLSACGSDSTGPSNLDANAALQSLGLGIGSAGVSTPMGVSSEASFAAIAPFLDHVNVTIDGAAQTMFALGVRETFPAGTCMENLFIFPSIPPDNSICTSPDLGLGVILWQSHSASAPPDRMIVIVAEPGTSDFNFLSSLGSETLSGPAVAIYMQGLNSFWISASGSLTSQVAATSQSCSLPLPPYAKSGTCSVATFDEQGSITFEELSETATFSTGSPTGKQLTLTIPRQAIHGLWQDITETQQAGLPWDYHRMVGGFGQ